MTEGIVTSGRDLERRDIVLSHGSFISGPFYRRVIRCAVRRRLSCLDVAGQEDDPYKKARLAGKAEALGHIPAFFEEVLQEALIEIAEEERIERSHAEADTTGGAKAAAAGEADADGVVFPWSAQQKFQTDTPWAAGMPDIALPEVRRVNREEIEVEDNPESVRSVEEAGEEV